MNKATQKLSQTPLIGQFTIAYEVIPYKVIETLKKNLMSSNSYTIINLVKENRPNQ